MGYTKLFSEIIMSTVWREPNHIRLLWITMLALKDRYHVVNASLPGLADSARISMSQCKQALKVLCAPDEHSRTKEFDGRRIAPCDGGWVILNGEKYRQKMSVDERRDYQRIKQQEYRDRKKLENEALNLRLQSGQRFTHTEEEEDTKEEEEVREEGASKLAFSLILKDKTHYEITNLEVSRLEGLYPNVNVVAELTSMTEWCNDNKAKRKTKSGVKGFVTRWLNKENKKNKGKIRTGNFGSQDYGETGDL